MANRNQLPFLIWLILTAAWLAAAVMMALNAWPHMPLDISHTDPATRAAYDQAVLMHAGRYALIALLPPLVILMIVRFVTK